MLNRDGQVLKQLSFVHRLTIARITSDLMIVTNCDTRREPFGRPLRTKYGGEKERERQGMAAPDHVIRNLIDPSNQGGADMCTREATREPRGRG